MFAGIHEFEITPPKGLKLMGFARPPRPNQGAHDPLMGCCVYLESGGVQAALVTVDLLYAGRSVCAEIRARAEAETGVPADRIFICASHTHSGPRANRDMSVDGSQLAPEEEAYIQTLSDRIVSAIAQAKAARFPAQVGISQAICGAAENIGGNRDIKGGVADPRVGVVAVRDESGILRAALVNYALHPTLLRESNLLCTADYPGYIRKTVQEAFPGCAFGFFQGASGDQSSRYFREKEGYEEAQRFGCAIGRAAVRAIETCPGEANPVFAAASRSFPLQLRTFPPIEVLKETIRVKTAEYEALLSGTDAMATHNAKLKMYGAECKLQYAENLERNRAVLMKEQARVGAVRIGKNCLVAVMGEYFTEYGLAIKALTGAEITLVASLANGNLPGYVCTPVAYAEGGYEPDASMLREDFGLIMTDAAIQTARSLFSKALEAV